MIVSVFPFEFNAAKRRFDPIWPSAPHETFCLSNPEVSWYNFRNYLTLRTRFSAGKEHPLRLAPILSAILLLIFCSSPYAQVFYQYPDAPTVEPGGQFEIWNPSQRLQPVEELESRPPPKPKINPYVAGAATIAGIFLASRWLGG